MSATSFLRHRRAAAVKYIQSALEKSPKRVADVLLTHDLTPDDIPGLAGNNDVLSIADEMAAERLDEAELDTLETLNTIDNGPRAAVHSPDVRDDQFEDRMQHPCQETVGVGNMHDAIDTSAEDLANVSKERVDANDGSLADAAKEKVKEEGAKSADLPPAAPTSAPAAENQVTAEDDQPTDPDHVNEGPETVVDRQQAATDLAAKERHEDKLEAASDEALEAMDRDQLFAYADQHTLKLSGITSRTALPTIRRQIRDLEGKHNG